MCIRIVCNCIRYYSQLIMAFWFLEKDCITRVFQAFRSVTWWSTAREKHVQLVTKIFFWYSHHQHQLHQICLSWYVCRTNRFAVCKDFFCCHSVLVYTKCCWWHARKYSHGSLFLFFAMHILIQWLQRFSSDCLMRICLYWFLSGALKYTQSIYILTGSPGFDVLCAGNNLKQSTGLGPYVWRAKKAKSA